MTHIGIYSFVDVDYAVRQGYIEEINTLRGNFLHQRYTRAFDFMKQRTIEKIQKEKIISTVSLKYSETQIFLLYHPDYKIAKTFDIERDADILLWDFSMRGNKRLKRQIFRILMEILQRERNPNRRREKYLLPLKNLYEYSMKQDIKDLRQMEKVEELEFLADDVWLQTPEIYKYAEWIINYCRKFLFLQNGIPCWNASVWYLEKIYITKQRNFEEIKGVKLSYLEIKNIEGRKFLKKYMKYLLEITQISISYLYSIFIFLKQFMLYLEEEGYSLIELNNSILDLYFRKEEKKRNQATTFNQKVRTIKNFLNYLIVCDLIPNLAFSIEDYLKKQQYPVYQTIIEEADIKSFIESNHLKQFPVKIRLMCFLLIFSGIQKKSLFLLKVSDLIWKNDTGWLRIKRNSEYREIPISDQLYLLVAEYSLEQRLQSFNYLFQNKNGDKYNSASFRKIIMEGCEKIGILKGKYVFKGNDYKKYIAKFFYQNKMSISAIREYMGYNSDEVIKDYVNLKQDRLSSKNKAYLEDEKNSLTIDLIVKKGGRET